MMKKTLLITLALILSMASSVIAEEMKGSGHEMKGSGGEMAEMSPEQMEMMKNFEMYSTPGDMHTELAKMAGSWDAEIKHWMAYDAPVEISQGTAENEVIFGGRFVTQKFKSEWMGQPFEGFGLFGYDNIQKEFQSIWLDSMATGIMYSAGTLAEDGTMVEEGTFSCPLTNNKRWNRSVTTFLDDNTFTFEMFMKDVKTDEEFRSMIITYTRKI